MKYGFLSLVFLAFLSACNTDATPEVRDDTFVPEDADTLVSSAAFVSDVHPTSGTLLWYDTKDGSLLQFENFSSDNGPDLRVYVSTDLTDNDFIDLGSLKAVSGNFSYSLDSTVDLEKYNNILIWCEDFSVLFGHASLP